jgi:hypothetical protein
MQKHIEKFQQKPYHIRKALFYLAVGTSMALIVGLWVRSLNTRVAESLQPEKIQREFRPFSLFSKSISNTYTSTREAVGGFSDGLSATVGGAPLGEVENTETIEMSTETETVPEI